MGNLDRISVGSSPRKSAQDLVPKNTIATRIAAAVLAIAGLNACSSDDLNLANSAYATADSSSDAGNIGQNNDTADTQGADTFIEECDGLSRADIIIKLQKYLEATTGLACPIYNPEEPTFSDVPTNHPAYKAINCLSAMGIVKGYSDSSFGPESKMMKVEFLKIIATLMYELTGEEVDISNTKNPYVDVSENDLFYPYIMTLIEKGLIVPTSDKLNPASYLCNDFVTPIMANAPNIGSTDNDKIDPTLPCAGTGWNPLLTAEYEYNPAPSFDSDRATLDGVDRFDVLRMVAKINSDVYTKFCYVQEAIAPEDASLSTSRVCDNITIQNDDPILSHGLYAKCEIGNPLPDGPKLSQGYKYLNDSVTISSDTALDPNTSKLKFEPAIYKTQISTGPDSKYKTATSYFLTTDATNGKRFKIKIAGKK